MKRTVEDLQDGRFKITESTGEIHYTTPERPVDGGYRLFEYVAYPILTQSDIETCPLPHFNVDSFTTYPNEGDRLFHPMMLSSKNQHVMAERVARVKIAFNLNLFESEDN